MAPYYNYPPYGGVASAHSYEMERKRQFVIIGLAVAIAIVLITAIILFLTHPWDRGDEIMADNTRTTLTESRMIQIFDGLDVEDPDMSNFRYVKTEDLIGPKYEDETMGNVRERGSGASVVAEQDISCNAQFHNKDLTVYLPLTITLTYDVADKRWVPGETKEGTVTAVALKPPPVQEIMADFFEFLGNYDQTEAQRFANATVEYTDVVTVDGGTINVTLSADEGTQITTADVTLAVEWSDTNGWAPYVSYMSQPTSRGKDSADSNQNTPQNPDNGTTPTTPNGASGNNSGSGLPYDLILDYVEGKYAQLDGTIEGSAGALRLRLNQRMNVNFREVAGGQVLYSLVVDSIDLVVTTSTRVGDSIDNSTTINSDGSNLVGRRVRVTGPLARSSTGITMDARLIS